MLDKSARKAARARVKLSETSKLGCLSWSLTAFDTCPGAMTPDGVADACQGCYARGGFYAMPGAKAVREFNREDWKRDDWADDMVSALQGESHFRWFDSGDAYDLRLAEKIYSVMLRTEWCQHWLPTRMHKFAKFATILGMMNRLPNTVVRASSDSVTGERVKGQRNDSTIIPTAADATHAMTVCEAYTRGGKCGPCRACWDESVQTIAYPAHGSKMLKVIRLSII
jgi:hypothetical protein